MVIKSSKTTEELSQRLLWKSLNRPLRCAACLYHGGRSRKHRTNPFARVLSVQTHQIALKARNVVYVRGARSCVEPEAERPPSRRVSSYDITDDLPDQIRSQLADARAAQFGDLSGAMTKKQCQTWTAFKAFMANRVLTKEQVEHQQREEYKHLPGILNYHTASPFIRRKIDASRAKEWKKYEVFQAAIPIKGQDLFDLLQRVM